MPIRMEKDPEQEQPRRDDSPERNTGGGIGGGLGQLLPFLLMFVFKRPKILIPVLLVGAIWYFFFGGSQMFSGGVQGGEEDSGPSQFSFGATLSEAEYDKADVFEPLSATYGGAENQLPPAVSLLKYAPKRMHQGEQGSCVGWASSYAARTILQARATGADPNSVAFSPAYLYNQIALDGCQGAYMNNAMETLLQHGDLPFSKFSYDDRSCDRQPNQSQANEAAQFRIKGYNRLSQGGNNYGLDMQGVKQHLAQGAPVVIGMMVGGTFMHQMMGRGTWQPTQRDYSGYGFSGHAMCVIGYDDNKQAVQIMNSWGPEWGDNGTAWVPYDAFQNFTKEAYGLYPMGDAAKYDPNKLAVRFGLVENESQTLIPLQAAGDHVFRTRAPMRLGTKFKVAITNSIECYVYVFGQETDGSSYVLFPYTEKHSPYCGITGTRLFPKDHSMTPDDKGKRDYIAIVVSKKQLDWNVLNSRINTSRQGSYVGKVREAVAQEEVPNVKFNVPDAVDFSCELNGKNVVATVIEIDK
ncbi:MAG: C39 family peptidase [Lewinellaceae bacterium]|nr:C39 family peptidase [Saprospiraceae bacterium]MCB9338175.1 C39 family peptidase [Lewinellaceae bacterium]